MSEKPTVAIGLLSGCFGCLMSFLDLADDLPELLGRVELRRTPFNDVKEVEEVTIGILEGAVSTDENLELARKMREKSQILISLGACSSLGGIPGLLDHVFLSMGRPPRVRSPFRRTRLAGSPISAVTSSGAQVKSETLR